MRMERKTHRELRNARAPGIGPGELRRSHRRRNLRFVGTSTAIGKKQVRGRTGTRSECYLTDLADYNNFLSLPDRTVFTEQLKRVHPRRECREIQSISILYITEIHEVFAAQRKNCSG